MEKWSFLFSTSTVYDYRYKGIFKNYTFYAKNNEDAKKQVLALTKKFISRLRRKDLYIYVHAMPYLKNGVLDGERLLRLRDRFSNKSILNIKNPDVALVQGYGPEALEKLSY